VDHLRHQCKAASCKHTLHCSSRTITWPPAGLHGPDGCLQLHFDDEMESICP
jgi:hypothetical protein